jgi:hypothetical protein
MEELKAQIDLYLTEVSIELLGNKFYDINGGRQNKLIELFKAVPEHKTQEKPSNDLICSLGYDEHFSESSESTSQFLEEQFDYILEDANKSSKTNAEIIENLRKLKADQSRLLNEASCLHVRKLMGKQHQQ